MSSIKIQRISSELLRHLSNIIFEEADNEMLKSVTLMEARVTSDLSMARIYYTNLGDYEWFKLENFSTKEFAAKEIKEKTTGADYDLATSSDAAGIEYIFELSDEVLFFQKVTRNAFIKKRSFIMPLSSIVVKYMSKLSILILVKACNSSTLFSSISNVS